MSFGSNNEDTTFVIEKEGVGSEELKVVREDKGFDLERWEYNTGFCVFKKVKIVFMTKCTASSWRTESGLSSIPINDLTS